MNGIKIGNSIILAIIAVIGIAILLIYSTTGQNNTPQPELVNPPEISALYDQIEETKKQNDQSDNPFIPKNPKWSNAAGPIVIDNDEYVNYRDKILSNYPNSDFSKYIINLENIEMEHLPSKTLSDAEKLKDIDLLKSIELYKKVMSIDRSSDSSKIASYFLGMHYDYEVSLIDSAKYYYEYIVENFPSSSQAQNAAKRLEVLNAQ